MKRLSVDLQDRVLRYDGVSVIHPDGLAAAMLAGVPPDRLRLTEHSTDSLLFNDNAPEQVTTDVDEPVRLDFSWHLPAPYLDLNLYEAVGAAFEARLPSLSYTAEQQEVALDRLAAELEEVERRGMVQFVKTIIYVLDTFRQEGVIWGVGRGSSCASYVLFTLGLHSVDPVLYNVPMSEFFHD